MDATIVRSEDPAALGLWLTEHGFQMRPALEQWIASYCERHYVFTAFQYRRPPEARGAVTRAVRLRFETDRAFFPYAEPTDAPAGSHRPFRLAIISDQPLRGTVGARTLGAAELIRRHIDPATLRADGFDADWLGRYAFDGSAPGTWATVLDEAASVRGPDDLFFEPDPTGEDNVPERVFVRHEVTVIPLDVLGVLLSVAAVAVLLFVRRRA
jgi:hypothetical protein